jgi:xanthine dehydrogenase small subunit
MPPVLLALEASLELASVRGTRTLPLEDFFLGYRKTALAPDEVIRSLSTPRLWPGEVFFCDKLSKRRDQDISTVSAGYRLRIKEGVIEDVRIGFGGMAATPKRASTVEAALKGRPVSAETFEAAAKAVSDDFQPIDDWRGSASYRLAAAANLLRRLYRRIAEPGHAVEVEAL